MICGLVMKPVFAGTPVLRRRSRSCPYSCGRYSRSGLVGRQRCFGSRWFRKAGSEAAAYDLAAGLAANFEAT